eukprot:1139524-Pelagomonas_calceolata.AAC.20
MDKCPACLLAQGFASNNPMHNTQYLKRLHLFGKYELAAKFLITPTPARSVSPSQKASLLAAFALMEAVL